MNLNHVGLSSGLSPAGLGVNLAGRSGMGPWRGAHMMCIPCRFWRALGILPPAIPQGIENMLHKNAFMLVYCVIKEKHHVFGYVVTMIYSDSY